MLKEVKIPIILGICLVILVFLVGLSDRLFIEGPYVTGNVASEDSFVNKIEKVIQQRWSLITGNVAGTNQDAIDYWKLDGDLKSSVDNNHGSGNVNCAVNGKVDGGCYLDGTNSILISDADKYSFGDGAIDKPFSGSAWVNVDSDIVGSNPILSKWNAEVGTAEYTFFVKGNYELTIVLRDTSTGGNIAADAVTPIMAGRWEHVAFSYDGSGSAEGLSLYLNGEVLPVTFRSGNYTAMENTDQPLRLGVFTTGTGTERLFKGLLDEVKIYDYELTLSDMDQYKLKPVVTTTPGFSGDCTDYGSRDQCEEFIECSWNNGCIFPVPSPTTTLPSQDDIGYWKLDGDLKSSVDNNHGSGNVNCAVNGKVDGGCYLDGTNSILISDADKYSFGDGAIDKPFSGSAWVNVDSDIVGSNPILSKWNSENASDEYSFFVKGNYELTIVLRDTSTGGNIAADAVTPIMAGRWEHVAFSYDGSGSAEGFSLYLNGEVLPVTFRSGNYTAMENTDQPLRFGVFTTGTGTERLYKGLLDEVKIYDYELTLSDIDQYKLKPVVTTTTTTSGFSGDCKDYLSRNQCEEFIECSWNNGCIFPVQMPTTTLPSCQITSAEWDTTAQIGDDVTLSVFTNYCENGLNVKFEVFEDDILDADDAVNVNPGDAVLVDGIATTTWIVEDHDDCAGLCNPPEYYFIGSVDDVSVESGLLGVVETSAVPKIYPGDTCELIHQGGDGNPEKNFDLVLVGDKFVAFKEWEQHTDEFISDFFAPFYDVKVGSSNLFTEYSERINIWRVNEVTNLDCRHESDCAGGILGDLVKIATDDPFDRMLCCDFTEAKNAAEHCPKDLILAIEKSDEYLGTAFISNEFFNQITQNPFSPFKYFFSALVGPNILEARGLATATSRASGRIHTHEIGHMLALLPDYYRLYVDLSSSTYCARHPTKMCQSTFDFGNSYLSLDRVRMVEQMNQFCDVEVEAIESPFPNPFDPVEGTQKQQFLVSYPSENDHLCYITMHVYNEIGQEVRALVSDVPLIAGEHIFEWDGRNNDLRGVANGVYFYVVTGGYQDVDDDFSRFTSKVTLLKSGNLPEFTHELTIEGPTTFCYNSRFDYNYYCNTNELNRNQEYNIRFHIYNHGASTDPIPLDEFSITGLPDSAIEVQLEDNYYCSSSFFNNQLKPGNSCSKLYRFTPSESQFNMLITATIDPDNKYAEFNEGDNSVSVEYDIATYEPDLFGFVDIVPSGEDCTLTGWLIDDNQPTNPISFSAIIDGKSTIGPYFTETDRPDICDEYGSSYETEDGICQHGFGFQLPNNLKDGKLHTLQIPGIDTSYGFSCTKSNIIYI